jgi:hypothetical protein
MESSVSQAAVLYVMEHSVLQTAVLYVMEHSILQTAPPTPSSIIVTLFARH